MSPASRTPQHDPGGAIHLRPHGATVLSVVTGILAVLLTLDAVIRAGWQGVAALPLLVLMVVLVWMFLWAPRVVLHPEAVEVRNIFVTHHLPFASLTGVRLGAMLRLETVSRRGRPVTVTAWNAPALGRENPLRRESSMREEGLRGRPATSQERMAQDQSGSRSAVIKQRWMHWMDARDAEGVGKVPPAAEGSEEGSHVAPTVAAEGEHPVTRVNIPVIVVLAVALLLVAARLLL